MKTNVKTNFRNLILLCITTSLLYSCATLRGKSTKLYLSFPPDVNHLIETYQDEAEKNNIEIYMAFSECVTDSCQRFFELLIEEKYPPKNSRSQYDEFITTNTFFHTKHKDIPIVINSNAYIYFRHYLKYPVSDNATGSEYPFQIYFTQDSLVKCGYNWNLIHCKYW